MGHSHAAIILLLLSFGSASALGQGAPPDELRRAKDHFKRGEIHYRMGEFNEALRQYQSSYKLDPRTGHIFNIAQCYRQLKNGERALFYYRLYLSDWERLHPGTRARYHQEVQRHIELLSRRRATSAPSASRPTTTELHSPHPPGSRWKRTVGWFVLGADGVTVATGLVFGAMVRSQEEDYDQAKVDGGTYTSLQEIADSGRRYEVMHVGMVIGGGVLIGAGAALVLWDALGHGSAAERSVSVAPYAGPGGGGVVGTVSF